jgi:hypothetical protein
MPSKIATKYFGEFTDRKDVQESFRVMDEDMPTEDEILVAVYEYGDYEGAAFVLYMQDGTLYEVNGSHCSCDGLEYQWEPEATTWEAIEMRSFYKSDNWPEHKAALKVARELFDDRAGGK